MQVITTSSGHQLGVYVAEPADKPRGCVVVVHEAFGVTDHIQRVCEDFAGQGYLAVAPAMFSWATGTPEGTVLGQDKDGLDQGREMIGGIGKDKVIETVQACVDWAATKDLKTAVVGYCWGGSCAYLSSSHIPEMVACSGYYGGWLWEIVAEAQPTCPRMVHMAQLDRYIPLEKTRAAFAKHDPACGFYDYPADHGFNRDDGKTFEPESAKLARERTLQLFEKAFK